MDRARPRHPLEPWEVREVCACDAAIVARFEPLEDRVTVRHDGWREPLVMAIDDYVDDDTRAHDQPALHPYYVWWLAGHGGRAPRIAATP